MARRSAGFSLIQILFAVVIVGVLIGLAVGRFKRMKEDSVVATLSSDLTALAALQAAFAQRYHDYAGAAIPSGTPDTSGSGAGQVVFTPTGQNIVDITWRSSSGYAAVASNPATTRQCGLFVGEAAYSPNAAVTIPGIPVCW